MGELVAREDILEAIGKLDWLHSIPLGNGITTPGKDQHYLREAYLHIPESLDGLSVLDIGTWDGYFAFQAEARGAFPVIAIDTWEQPWGSRGEGFRLAKKILNSKVQGIKMDVCELPGDLGRFDVIFFFGVLYHLRYPLLALDQIRKCCHDETLLIVESHIDLLNVSRPVAGFYENDELGHDSTNWFGPNPACIRAWLRSAGFNRIEFVGGMNLNQNEGVETIQYGRGAWHARP